MWKSKKRRPSLPTGVNTELNAHSAPLNQEYEDPPDGGYGWVQVAVCFTVNGFTWGQVAVGGIALNCSAAELTPNIVLWCISLLLSFFRCLP